MALVVLLRGVNVGGHRRFRPTTLAGKLRHLGTVNIGATGTFVIRRRVGRARLREEIARRLPFEAEIMICSDREIAGLLSRDFLAGRPSGPGIVRFVSVLSRIPRSAPELPVILPPSGRWLMRIVAREGRFVLGEYRRDMKVVGYLGTLDRIFGVPATTRNLNTIKAICRVLDEGKMPGAVRKPRVPS